MRMTIELGLRCIALGALPFVAGCDSILNTMVAPPPQTEVSLVTDFDQRAPVEVAILPIRRPLNFTEQDGADFLGEIYDELLSKNYTPLNPDYVLKNLPAGFAPEGMPDVAALTKAIPADAYFLVDLHKADVEGKESSRPRYRLDATAWLLDANGSELYRHGLVQTYDVTIDGSGLLPALARRDKLKLFSGRLLTGLPMRRFR